MRNHEIFSKLQFLYSPLFQLNWYSWSEPPLRYTHDAHTLTDHCLCPPLSNIMNELLQQKNNKKLPSFQDFCCCRTCNFSITLIFFLDNLSSSNTQPIWVMVGNSVGLKVFEWLMGLQVFVCVKTVLCFIFRGSTSVLPSNTNLQSW